MQKAIIAVIVVVILAIGGWALTKDNKNSSNSQTNQPAQNSTNQQPAASANSVTIKDMAFSPANISVAKGTKVTWTNNDSITHTVTESDSQKGPASQPLSPGSSYSFTFDQAGTFHYHCTIHPEMTGTVTVTDTSAATPSNSSNTTNTTPAQTNTNNGNPY